MGLVEQLLFWFFKLFSVFLNLILSNFPVIIFTGLDKIRKFF